VVEIAFPGGAEAIRRRPRLGYALTISAATLFALNGAVSKLGLEASEMGAMRWAEVRATGAFAGLALVIALAAPARLRPGRHELAALVLYGLFGFAIVQWLYFIAIDRLPLGIALLLEFTAPVLIALWARFVWHEQIRKRVWAALALVVLGLVLVAQVWHGGTLDSAGVLAGLLAAVALAFFYLQGERLAGRRDPLSVVCLALGAASLFWAIVQPWWSFPFDTLTVDAALPGGVLDTAPVWVLVLWTVVLGTIVPFALSIAALRHLPATTVGVVATFEPVAGAVVAWAWLGESLIAVQILGGLVVLAGIVLAETSR
jgi:drug/metabolite transporter (DMT)-like permease